MKKLNKKLQELDSTKFQQIDASKTSSIRGGITMGARPTYVAIGGDTYEWCDDGCSGGDYYFPKQL